MKVTADSRVSVVDATDADPIPESIRAIFPLFCELLDLNPDLPQQKVVAFLQKEAAQIEGGSL